MTVVPFQVCRSSEGWQPVRVASSSGGEPHLVLVSPWTVSESICDCKGYLYRGRCAHQAQAASEVCRWTEKSGIQQTDLERERKRCPQCGESTKYEVDVV